MVEIRLLEPTDADQYRSLRLMALKESPAAFAASLDDEAQLPRDRWLQRVTASEERFALGAFAMSGLVGTVSFYRETAPKLRHKGELFAMYVRPEHRRRGIGRQLVQALLHRVGQLEGIEQINLSVNASNEAATRLYRSCGFVTYGLEKDALRLEATYYDEEHMVLALSRN